MSVFLTVRWSSLDESVLLEHGHPIGGSSNGVFVLQYVKPMEFCGVKVRNVRPD